MCGDRLDTAAVSTEHVGGCRWGALPLRGVTPGSGTSRPTQSMRVGSKGIVVGGDHQGAPCIPPPPAASRVSGSSSEQTGWRHSLLKRSRAGSCLRQLLYRVPPQPVLPTSGAPHLRGSLCTCASCLKTPHRWPCSTYHQFNIAVLAESPSSPKSVFLFP